ncbi:MAG: hypothetical protein LUE29_09580 [Lachnospiraceae bacterium]|nr:hypothetical protein [Lachnospiraceae bacterium]
MARKDKSMGLAIKKRPIVTELYFEWLCQFVSDNPVYPVSSYTKLLSKLHTIKFNYVLPMDGNREEDGTDLRYRFAYEHDYDERMIVTVLDDRPCSVLEMMVALAVRCEEHIMDDPEIGNRTSEWFWGMIKNLGLMSMTDDNFSDSYVDTVITRFLDQDYEKNGKGGLFTVDHCGRDLRTVDIWCQLCWYLDEISE